MNAMPSSRPRGVSGTNSGTSSGRPIMSERQQISLLMQMTTSSNQSELSPGGGLNPARSRDRNERGETALHVAAIKGDQEGVKKLLEQGMSPNVTDFAEWTPLHEACNYGHYNVALILIKSGANVNAKGLDDDTPLHDAAIVGQLKLVKMLVEKGADPCFKNRKGKTPCDVAAPAVYNFLLSAKDNAANRNSQQLKKPPDTKKSNVEETDDGGATSSGTSSGTNTNSSVSKEEDDIYEFKSTPKDINSGDDKSDGGKSSDKSSDEKSVTTDDGGSGGSSSGTGSGGSNSGIAGQTKRVYSDIEGQDETSSIGDDENKRKKRKDSEPAKDTNKNVSGNRLPIRQEKGKIAGPASKTIGLNSKAGTGIDRKSPCASPKPVPKTTDSDAETDDNKNNENFSSQGPKVPPLKIVIPQNAAGDQETGSRNGKNTSTRNHPALPYVVASSNSGNESNTDKESSSSRCASPAEIAKLPDEKVTKTVVQPSSGSAEERAQQRVLRSSHRTGGQTVDRGSNNSSPQLQSSSPSPAPTTGNSAETTGNTTQPTTTGNNNGSPSNPTQSTSESETTGNVPSPSASTSATTNSTQQNTVELHPRKRKIRASKEENKSTTSVNATVPPTNENENLVMKEEVHPQDQPITNCYQMYLNIRKQIERRQRNLFPVQPKPPQGFKDYLMNRCTYVLAGKTPAEPSINFPTNLSPTMKEMFQTQEKERHKLKMQHVVEKEKLVLAVEQEILRVHGRAARALANQSLPFSVCTILKDEEVYNMITPEQEEKDRNARSRYNGRLFLSWLQDVDDKWEKIKEAMLFRHHNEVESLHAVQKMDWEWKMKELLLCEFKAKPVIDDQHVPIVHVSDDFDLLPA